MGKQEAVFVDAEEAAKCWVILGFWCKKLQDDLGEPVKLKVCFGNDFAFAIKEGEIDLVNNL
ncbi:MAG: hypothetical protein IPN95_28980 [Bacteroidetes bacterium]|nr:hypothetical protein [Bacteroidota bacterium]